VPSNVVVNTGDAVFGVRGKVRRQDSCELVRLLTFRPRCAQLKAGGRMVNTVGKELQIILSCKTTR